MVNQFSITYCVTTFVSEMISMNEQSCSLKTSFMEITTFKVSKTNFMLFTKVNRSMAATQKKSKWRKIQHELKT